MKQGKMIGYFISGSTIRLLYQSKRFHQVLQFVQKNSSICKMKKNKLRLVCDCYCFDNVKNTRTALEFMEMLGGE
jgi:transcription-repair coupling factor (superfamily II helicase)